MDNNTPPQQPPQGQQSRPQPPQPQPQPLSILPPPTIISSLHQNHSHFHLPFPPPTTPNSSSSSTTTHHKKRRSKLLHMDTITTTEPPLKTPKHSLLSHSEVIPPCTECGKVFWSWKALFGHMRCHPERPWRGIKPPPSHLQHRTLPLTPPPPTPPSPPPLPSPYTSDDLEVAASLLLLASGPDLVDLVTSPPPPPPSAKFECSSCKKTFGSHQALGGHRASHKNVKGCFAITKNITDVEDDGHCMILHGNQNYEESVGLGLSLGLGLGSGSGHRCGICLKVFPTGQALGGHMRCHWEKNEEQHQQAQASSSTFGLGIGPVSRPSEAQCGLDLNLPAQLVDGGSSSKDVQLDLRLRL